MSVLSILSLVGGAITAALLAYGVSWRRRFHRALWLDERAVRLRGRVLPPGVAPLPGEPDGPGRAGAFRLQGEDRWILADPELASGLKPGRMVTVDALPTEDPQRADAPLEAYFVVSGAWPRLPGLWHLTGGAALLTLLAVAAQVGACQGSRPVVSSVRQGRRPAPQARAPVAVKEQDPAAEARTGAADPQDLQTLMVRLSPLHRAMGPVQPGDWLAQHDEPGQTFQQYLQSDPVHARGGRRVIYLLPLGTFEAAERRALDLTSQFLALYFCLPVRVLEEYPLSAIPARARRVHPTWGDHQILTTYVLEELLAPRLPADAATMLALTASDLWPGRGWNFVFGQASLRERVGVWSIYRNGDPNAGKAGFRRYLLRTIKTATHETGHMFSIAHCTAYECNMCGCNNREEADRRPLALCPHCLAKVLWATGCDARGRSAGLLQLSTKLGFTAEAAHYREALKLLPPAAASR